MANDPLQHATVLVGRQAVFRVNVNSFDKSPLCGGEHYIWRGSYRLSALGVNGGRRNRALLNHI